MTITHAATAPVVDWQHDADFARRRATARRIFRAALLFNAALTLFWLFVAVTGTHTIFFQGYMPDADAIRRVGARARLSAEPRIG